MAPQHRLDLQSGKALDLINAAAAGLVGRQEGLNQAQTVEALERLLSAVGGEAAKDIAHLERLLNHLPLTICQDAIETLGPKDAFALMLEGDAHVLVSRVLAASYLAQPEIPLYPLNELSSQVNQFLAYQWQERDSLVRTGRPTRCFGAARWLYRLLPRLYDTRSTSTPDPRDERRPDRPEASPAHGWGPYVPPSIKFRGLTLVGTSLQEGADEDASCPPGMKPEDVARIEADREKLFDLRCDVLGQLPRALRGREADGLWEKCWGLFTALLTPEDVEFYFRMDAFYLRDDIQRGGSKDVNRRLIPGGLTNLLEVAGHVDKEISIGTMDRTREALARVFQLTEGGGRPFDGLDAGRAYVDSVKRHGRGGLDAALDSFLSLAPEDDAFWTAYCKRFADAVAGRSAADVTVTKKAPKRYEDKIRLMTETYMDYIVRMLELTGEVPALTIVANEAAGGSGQTRPPRKKQALVKFPSPPGLRWDEVTLVFLSKDLVRLEARGIKARHTCAELGFKDKHRDRPDSLWTALRIFADPEKIPPKGVHPLKKPVSVLRQRLQDIFGIADDPFHSFRTVKKYRPKFRVEDRAPPTESQKNQEDDD